MRLLCLLAVPLLVSAAGNTVKAEYVGGTVAGLSAKSSARLDLTDPDTLVFRCGSAELRIDYQRINEIEYGQNVSRRYAEAILISPFLLLAKSRKHFVTIGYEDAGGRQEALVFRVAKGDIRPALASLEARTGRRIEYQDEEARKSMRR